MAGHRQSPSTSSASSDDTNPASGLLDKYKHDLSDLQKPSSPTYVFEKQMAHSTSPASHWVRVVLAKLPALRARPARLLAAVIGLFVLVFFFHRTGAGWYSGAADSNFVIRGHHIPPKIWQVMFTTATEDPDTGHERYDIDPSKLPYSISWVGRNPDYDFRVINKLQADDFMLRHYSDDQWLMDIHDGLRNHGPKSDLMRYELMYIEGGVYSDTDVTCLKPIDTWIPLEWRDRVKAIVGIEGDSLGGPVISGMLWDVQFGQWTVAAVPRHRLFKNMIDSVKERLYELCELKGTTIDKLAMTEIEIMNTTATALWSETIFKELQRITANSDAPLEKFSDLSGMTEPRLYEDIMVLPIDYIGSGVPHSNASPGIPDVAIVKHHFSGSWRGTDGIEGRDA